MTSTTASAVVSKLKGHFARYGCPDVVISDNGPQFDCEEFAKFAAEWEFEHVPISPYNSKANGKAESAVKTAKSLLRKSMDAGTDAYLALLDYRNTPTQGLDSSPAQRLMNRRTKTLLPTKKSLLQPRMFYPEREKLRLEEKQERQRKSYDRGAKDLKPLTEGDVVRMKPFKLGQKEWKKAVVTKRLDERSYDVEEEEGGGVYRRNRYHLKKTKEPAHNLPTPTTPAATMVLEEGHIAQDEQPQTRPQRDRRPPAYLKDYVTNEG